MTDSQHSLQRTLPLFVIGGQPGIEHKPLDRSPDNWLLQRDITVHDLPYIQLLVRTAYVQWLSDIPVHVHAQLGKTALFDYRGECLESDLSPIGSNEPLLLSSFVNSVLSEQSTQRHIIDDVSGYIGVPIVSRHSKLVAAVIVFDTKLAVSDHGQLAVEGWMTQFHSAFYREFEHMFINEIYYSQRLAERESKRRDILYDVVRHIHDHIDVDSVISQIIEGIDKLVPEAKLEVYLSQDHRSENPNVKALIFKSWSDPLVMQAFMNGEACYAETDDSGLEVAVALTGKQGSYGVLKMIFYHERPDPSDIQLIQLIIETAGTAFENARLHEQANAVIQELRFINDLTKRINQSLRLRDVFHDATHELLRVFRADFCMLLQLSEDKSRFEVVSSNMVEYNGATLPSESGLFGYMFSLREPVIVSDSQEQIQDRMQFFEQLNLRSVIASPLFGGGEMVGIVVVADKRPHFFTYDNFKLLQMLAGHMGLAIANATLHARVKHLANKDQLTGLYARHYLDKQINRQQKNDFCGSLIVVDIDYFKQINDKHGHQIGDKILNQVSEIIRSSIREADIAARWGGEELAVYLPQLNVNQTVRVAERIRARVANETSPHVTVSCGIAEWNWQDEKISVESLFYRADMALYDAKNCGRNQIRISSSS
ncbi:sensor domain-containing diguanylate cyclase [Paenibacillus sp. UMB4589-SE434]|uniref:GGDEF domain-containing protein n=1 Tax=Paenibacillus sp. UMB4589-SE434 TaxID=3046314 RepID=UPI00254CBEF0|nr:sensor domain-containing diguanylate cyclase [Paenibacillus sp. UMB4589-SE434]MDK8180866.1 sensor domain-containing diguanylate cyclase [Paenibacillus sp. UMB4589-SE434]